MARPRQLRFCREGLYYTAVFLAMLIGAVSRQLNLLMLIGCVMFGPLLFSLLYGRMTLGGIGVERRLPSHLHAGMRLRVDLTVSNVRRRLGVWALKVSDTLEREDSAGGETARAVVLFPYVSPGQSRQAHYEGFLPQRGRYYFGPLRVSTRFPLGLIQHSQTVDERAELLVHPRLGRINPGWQKMIRENESGSERMPRRGLLEAEFYGLREWRPGDSRRWIHWRTSARRGRLIVRQFEQRRSQDLAILLDLWQPTNPSAADRDRVETAISFVATLIDETCRKPGAQLSVNLAAREFLQDSGPGTPLFLREQMDALALVHAHVRPTLPTELGHALALVPQATPTFVVSTRAIDWDRLAADAADRDSQLDGRRILGVDVGTSELTSFFHATDSMIA